MTKALAAIGLHGKSGKRAEEHDDDEEAKRAAEEEEEKEKEAAAKAAEEEEEKKAAEAQEDDEDEKEAKAAASAAKTASLSARAITDLCALARKPELAGEFIASGASQAAVRRKLLADRADASGAGEIAGQTGPVNRDAHAGWDHSIARVQGRYNAGQSA